MRRGEIRWYRFQRPDKNRPVLILSRDPVIEYLGEVAIAPVTTTIRDIPSEVLLTKADGLPRECVVNCDHLQTVSKGKIGPLIAMLSTSRMAEVAEAVSFALALTE
jgi:mRNA interferase MazF